MYKAEDYGGFRNACLKGHTEIIKCLCETFKDSEMNKTLNYYGFRKACFQGRIDIVKYLWETYKDSEMI